MLKCRFSVRRSTIEEMYFDPSDETVHLLLERGITGPIVMLNLLRFRETADYWDHPELAPATPISGREAYEQYMSHTMPFLLASGGSLDFVGDGGHFFVGPVGERWDLAILVRQASIESFFEFASNDAYLAGAGHRSAALEDSRILPLTPRQSG